MQAYDFEVPDEGSLWKLMKGEWVDTKCPGRVRLRSVVDFVYEKEARGEKLDLQRLRRLVTCLVENSARHALHSNGMGKPPVLGKDACARKGEKGVVCRYGFPKNENKFPRGGDRKMRLKKVEGREGCWEALFPRNDACVCSYEAHVLLANLGNVDWRPVMNLWSVMEYITKYATKAQKGSRAMGEVLRSAAEEVCRYSKEDGVTDLLRRSFQKCFARTLGERDYGIFEATHLGLGLPLVLELLPVVSLNTSGARAFKT